MTTTMSISRYDTTASGLLRLCPTWAVSGCRTPTCRAGPSSPRGTPRRSRSSSSSSWRSCHWPPSPTFAGRRHRYDHRPCCCTGRPARRSPAPRDRPRRAEAQQAARGRVVPADAHRGRHLCVPVAVPHQHRAQEQQRVPGQPHRARRVTAARELRVCLATGQLRCVRAQLGALHVRRRGARHRDVATGRVSGRARLRQAPTSLAGAVRSDAVPAEHARDGLPAGAPTRLVRHRAGLHPHHGVGCRRGAAARDGLPQLDSPRDRRGGRDGRGRLPALPVHVPAQAHGAGAVDRVHPAGDRRLERHHPGDHPLPRPDQVAGDAGPVRVQGHLHQPVEPALRCHADRRSPTPRRVPVPAALSRRERRGRRRERLTAVTSEDFPYEMTRAGVVMRPDLNEPYEVEGVLNPSVVWSPDGHLVMFPRVVAQGNWSRIAAADVVTTDGVPTSVVRRGIVLEPDRTWEHGTTHGPRTAVATSPDLTHWTRLGPIQFAYDDALDTDLDIFPNKDTVWFPESI